VNVKEGENFIPVANDDDAITYVNVPVAIEVLANDTGLEDGFGSLEIFKYPAFGSVVVNDNNTITYTPSNYFVGTVTFMYKLYDVDGDFDVATVTVRVFDANNPKPIAVDDLLGTSFNTPVTINVLANDLGLDDAPITVTVLSEPDSNKGTAVVNQDNTIHFVPATNYVGEVIFTYLVTDANGDFDDATVTVTVKDGANHIPIANDDRRGTSLNTSVDIDVLENDLGLEDIPIVVTISQIPDPLKGTAIANADNSVTFTPANSFVGEATFMYTVTDAEGDHDSALVTVTVKATENNEPIATDDLVTTHREVPVNIYVLSNDTGLEDTPLTLTIVNEVNPSIGTVQIVGNTYIRFTPAQGYLGVTTFSYRVEDVDGDYDIATVTVTVISTLIAVNDNVEVKRNESIIIDILANDMGISDITPEVTLIYHPTQGTAVINPDNTVTYTPDLDYFGADELTYRVCSQYGQCSEAVVSIDVKIDKFRIPEGFSPDGDGINDRFEIIGIEIFNQVKIRIYNRWGNLVYQSERYQNDWDGKSNASMAIGSTLPTGTYYYTIEIVDTKEKFSGNVFLKR
jgi:gliding motility-associated-like protein